MANKTFEGIDMSMTRCATFFKKTTSGKSRSDKIMMGEGCTMYRVSYFRVGIWNRGMV